MDDDGHVPRFVMPRLQTAQNRVHRVHVVVVRLGSRGQLEQLCYPSVHAAYCVDGDVRLFSERRQLVEVLQGSDCCLHAELFLKALCFAPVAD